MVILLEPFGSAMPSTISSAASRSACPHMRVISVSTTSPFLFSIRTWPM
jgi:hypothetical protein